MSERLVGGDRASPRHVTALAGAERPPGTQSTTLSHPSRTVRRMSKLRLVHRCTDCGASHPKWAGRCPACAAWNSLVEEVEGSRRARHAWPPAWRSSRPASPRRIGDIDAAHAPRRVAPASASSIACSAAASCPGSVTLLGGEPGIGKSTLLLQLLAGVAGPHALRLRPKRAPSRCACVPSGSTPCGPSCGCCRRPSLPNIVAAIDELQPELVVIDSIQTVADPELASAPGSVVQVRGCAHRLVQEAKRRGVTHRARRSRHQGGRARRAARARAPRRHRALVRGRAPPRAAVAARVEAPLRAHQRARPVRDGRCRPDPRARPEPAVPRRPPHRRRPARRWCRRIEGQRPLLVEVQALTNPPPAARPAAAVGAGPRSRPAGDAARRARTAGPPAGRHDRGLRLGRRRRQAHRARRRSRRCASRSCRR